MPETLTKEEQKSLDQLKKVCARKGPKAPATVQSCAVLKLHLMNEERQKLAELEAVARANRLERQQKALAYVSGRVNRLQSEGILLNAALLQVSAEYDTILAARATKSVSWGEIVMGLALAALPEIKLIGRVMNHFLPRKAGLTGDAVKQAGWRELKADVRNSTATSWEDLVREVEKATLVRDVAKAAKQGTQAPAKETVRFVDSLDNASKDIIEAFKNPAANVESINAEMTRNSRLQFQALNAKNQILTDVIGKLQRTLLLTMFLEPLLHRFIFWFDSPLLDSSLRTFFAVTGLDEDFVDPRAFELFPKVLLYDMLRAYVRNYVDYEIERGHTEKTVRQLPDSLEKEVYGLDSAQTKLIYDRFRTTPWNDPSRPPIKNFRDLIEHWDAKVVLLAREKAAENGRLGPMLARPLILPGGRPR